MTLAPEETTALLLSLKVAVWATLGSFPLGLLAAWLLARRNFYGKAALDALIHLPLILPPVVTGYLLLVAFGRKGLIGAWLADNLGIVFAFRWTGAALACAVMGFPLMVQAFRLSLLSIDRKLEQAAATLGASPAWVFLTITLPLMLPGLLTGLVLSFARAVGEFGATITFVSNIPGETQTLPLAIHVFLQQPDGTEPAIRLVVVSVVLAVAALVISEILSRRAAKLVSGQ